MLKMAFPRACILLLAMGALFSCGLNAAEEKEKRYRVEMVVFQNKMMTNENASELGQPELTGAIPFEPLPLNKLVLTTAKQKFSRGRSPVLHEGWLQTAGKKEAPTKTHVMGGKELGNGTREVQGCVQIIPGKQLFIATDLALFNTDAEQIDRIQSTIPVVFDEINYVNQGKHSMIIMVTPDITRRI